MDEILMVKDYLTPINGLFSHITYDFEFVEKPVLDLLVFTTFGERRVAPIVSSTLSINPTDEELTSLGKIVQSLYENKWDRYKTLLKIKYDPIRNYEDTLTETIHDTESNVGSENASSNLTINITGTSSDQRTDNLQTSTNLNSENSNTTDDSNSIYGFNSVNAVDSDKSRIVDNGTGKSNGTTSNTGTQSTEGTSTKSGTTTKSNEVSKDYNVTTNKTRESKHTGNIGNLTTQQLMKQEIELWKWNFIESILADLKDFLTIPIYF